jgi:glycosyltransferase involved in cell wall biosynthesis
MSMAKLTVCIPAYNQPQYLAEALESLCDQGLPRDAYRVVVSDDASPTSLAEVCASFAGRIDVIHDRSETNIGHLANFERAFTLAGTPYVSFLSHDDIVVPGQLGRALQLLERSPQTVLVAALALFQPYPGALLTRTHGWFPSGFARARFNRPYKWERVEWLALGLMTTPLCLIGSIFRAEVFRRCTAWRSFPTWHDRLMLAEMGLHGDVESLPWIGGHYRTSAGQLSGQLMAGDPREYRSSSEAVLAMSAQAGIPVVDFWIDLLCTGPADERPVYLRMLRDALPPAQFAELRGSCERRLGIRFPLTRLERFRVPSPIAKLIRDVDRAFATKPR